MLKSLLKLFASSASVVALLLVTNSSMISTALPSTSDVLTNDLATVNLNVVSPTIQLKLRPMSNHEGCSCPACTKLESLA